MGGSGRAVFEFGSCVQNYKRTTQKETPKLSFA
jgi:hypothetical protein